MIIVISVTLFFIVLRFTVTLFNFISNPKLTRVNRSYTDLVSILIPARNEEENILSLLISILKQDYRNYEVIIYDDESTDDTYAICTEFCSAHSNFSIIKGKALPDEWLGKNYACHQLSKKAKGKYLLFADANTVLSNGLINSAVHRMQLYKLGLLSVFPNQIMETLGEKVVVPLLNLLLLNLLPIRPIYLIKTKLFATASGQFMLFDADSYNQNQWHKKVKDEILEASEIMRLLKATGLNAEVLLANGMLQSRLYKSYRQAINGSSKNLLPAFSYNMFALLIYILLLIGGPLIIITTLNINLIFFMCGLIILMRIMVSLTSEQPALYNIILHPVQMFNLVIITFLSIHKHLTKSNIWKGRRI